MNGDHVYRHRSGIWNPIFSDQFWRADVYSVRQSQRWACWNHTTVGDGTVFDMEKLYGRMLVVSQQRHIDLRRVFSFELAPHPLSLFDEYGDMRKGSRATLVSKLAVLASSVKSPDLSIVDGNAMVFHATWPKCGTVQPYVNSFRQAVKRDHQVIVVFDRYRDNSIKSHEQARHTT